MCKSAYVSTLVMEKVEESEENSIFFLSDFAQYGAIESIRKILGQACLEGKLVHVAHGIYAKPKTSRFGVVPPSLELIAKAIANRDHAQIMPTGATAANMIGLSTQVPMTLNYLTTGSARTVNVGKRSIQFKRAAPRNFAFQGNTMPLIMQAMKEVGKENIGEREKTAIYTAILNSTDKQFHRSDLLLVPQWMQTIIKPIINKTSAN